MKIILIILSTAQVLFASDSEKLKALLVVGHKEETTQRAINNMEEIAELLHNHGIETYKFYDSKAKWSDIIKVAPECSFFIFAGHGYVGSDNSSMISLTSFVTGNMIIKDLKLKHNSIAIMQSVCYAAGSSASDNKDIGVKEAVRRVSIFSDVFFKTGASVYYAINVERGTYNFIKHVLSNNTMEDAFNEATFKLREYFQFKIECSNEFKTDSNKIISLLSSPGGNVATRTTKSSSGTKTEKFVSSKGYDVAFVASPSFKLFDIKSGGR
jgi:hypothetical protein